MAAKTAAAGAQGDTESAAGTTTETGETGSTTAAAAETALGTKAEPEGTADATTSKAPEKYALTVPEDATDYIGQDDLTFIEELARANDWTNDEAQADLVARVNLTRTRLEARGEALKAAIRADPDYGGAHYDETVRRARATIDRICPEGHKYRASFQALMNEPTVGNHPAVVAVLADLGKLMGEDGTGATRSSGDEKPKTIGETLYDHPDSKRLDGRT